MKTTEIPLFLGTTTAVDKRNLEPFQASRELNCRHEDGRLSAAYGYRNIRAAQASLSAVWGFTYLQGYNSSNTEVEEYVSIENVSGSVDAFARNVTTMAPTAITGATGLHASAWTGVPWDDRSYFINPNHTTDVYRHVIADTASWVGLAHPAAPTTALTAAITYGPSDETAYRQLSWAGLDPTSASEMACTGLATNTGSALNTDNTFNVRHTAGSGPGDASFQIDLSDITAGDQDWSYVDAIGFTMQEDPSGAFAIDDTTVVLTLINGDGSPVTFQPILQVIRIAPTRTLCVYAYAPDNKTRTLWDNIAEFKVSYRVTARSGTAANNDLTIGKPFLGCCFPSTLIPAQSLVAPTGTRLFAYDYGVNTTSLYSEIGGHYFLDGQQLCGYDPFGNGTFNLGAYVKFTIAASGDGSVDRARLFFWDNIVHPSLVRQYEPAWRQIVSQDDATGTYTLKASLYELIANTARTAAGGFLTTPVVNAFPYREWMVWCYQLGEANLRHSRVGEPEMQYSQSDPEDDENRGANFTLADNASDTPLGGCQAGGSAIIFGYNGVYEQIGDRPWNCTPPKKLPGAFGAAGKFAFARWRDDGGNAVVAFVDRHGSGVYAVYPSSTGDRDVEGRVVELSAGIRGELRRFLLDEQSTIVSDFTGVEVFVDEAQDALYVKLGKRALILRRPTLVTGTREWEFREWNTGGTTVTLYRVASSAKRRVRWIRSDGKTDEAEWNSDANVFVQGVNRDGGNPMPLGYWRSKAHSGENRRILRIFLERDRIWEPAAVTVRSTRRDQKYKIAAGKRFARCALDQTGFDHEFEIEVGETDGAVTRLFWDESKTGRRTDM